MLKSQKNKVYELFFATYNELYNMDKIERDKLLKNLTEKESRSHYYNSGIDRSEISHKLVCLTIAKALDKSVSDDLIEKIMQSCVSPRLGILVDFKKQSVSIIPTRSQSIKTDNFAIFNFEDDFDNPGLFMEMSSFDQGENYLQDSNFVNELISKIMFIKDLDNSDNKIKVLKNFYKLLEDSFRIIEHYNVLATMLIVYAKRTNASYFDKDYEKFYNQSTMVVFDALAFYSKEINEFQDDNLSFFNKIWLYHEQLKLKHFGYLSKNKKFFPFIKKQGFNFIF